MNYHRAQVDDHDTTAQYEYSLTRMGSVNPTLVKDDDSSSMSPAAVEESTDTDVMTDVSP